MKKKESKREIVLRTIAATEKLLSISDPCNSACFHHSKSVVLDGYEVDAFVKAKIRPYVQDFILPQLKELNNRLSPKVAKESGIDAQILAMEDGR